MATSDGTRRPIPSQAGAVLLRLVAASLLFLLSWAGLVAAYAALPSVLPGSDQVIAAKWRTMAAPSPFPATARHRIAIVGDSRILSGFLPDAFDEAVGDQTTSQNLGMPGVRAVVPSIDAIATWDPPPTHVLLGNAWRDRPEATWWAQLQDDRELLDKLFPFRRLPRDAIVFLARSGEHGGAAGHFLHFNTTLGNLERDRGYHFIASQSHFAEHRLPADFSHPSDHPDRPAPRVLPTAGPQLARLLELKEQIGFEVMVVPTYLRALSCAPAPIEDNPGIESLGIRVVGPAYWRYPEHLFSDSQHANADGARRYTEDLAKLLRPVLTGDP